MLSLVIDIKNLAKDLKVEDFKNIQKIIRSIKSETKEYEGPIRDINEITDDYILNIFIKGKGKGGAMITSNWMDVVKQNDMRVDDIFVFWFQVSWDSLKLLVDLV